MTVVRASPPTARAGHRDTQGWRGILDVVQRLMLHELRIDAAYASGDLSPGLVAAREALRAVTDSDYPRYR